MAGELPQLRDIHLPPEPSWWPPAPGWWILLAIAIIALVFFLLRRPRRRRARRDRAIVAGLARLEADWRGHRDDVRFAAALSEHLRRLSRLVREDSVALAGTQWIAFLDRHGDGFAELGDVLTDAPYRAAPAIDAARLYDTVQRHTRCVLATELSHV